MSVVVEAEKVEAGSVVATTLAVMERAPDFVSVLSANDVDVVGRDEACSDVAVSTPLSSLVATELPLDSDVAASDSEVERGSIDVVIAEMVDRRRVEMTDVDLRTDSVRSVDTPAVADRADVDRVSSVVGTLPEATVLAASAGVVPAPVPVPVVAPESNRSGVQPSMNDQEAGGSTVL